MVQSGDDYREKNRKRLQRFYERQKAEGKKRISITLSPNAYTKLKTDRDNTGSTLNAIVENAILEYGSDTNAFKVSDEAYRLLTDEKDQAGESISTLVDQAVMIAYGEQGIPDIMSDEAYALLMDAKEQTGDSMPMLIDRAVMAAYGDQGEDILDVDDIGWIEPVQEVTPSADAQGDDAEEIELDISLVDPDPDLIADDSQVPTATPQGDDAQDPAHVKDTAPGQEPDIIPDCTDNVITIEERDEILVHVAEMLPGRKNVQARLDLLNKNSIPVSLKSGQYGGEWDRKKFTDTLGQAKKRLGIK